MNIIFAIILLLISATVDGKPFYLFIKVKWLNSAQLAQQAEQPPIPNNDKNSKTVENNADSKRLAQRVECRVDIEKHCKKIIAQLGEGEILSDMVNF